MVTRIAMCALATLASVSAAAGEAARDKLAWRVVREHRLLSGKQLSCSTSLERPGSTDRLVKVGFYEKHDARCGGDPSVAHRLFDLEVDARTGRARWDGNDDLEMRPVPSRATGARTR